jgi:hypothetical protein
VLSDGACRIVPRLGGLIVALALVACGGGAGSPSPTAGKVSIGFSEVVASPMARHDLGTEIVVAVDDRSRDELVRSVPGLPAQPADRVYVAVFQGEQRTGGYHINVSAIERLGDRLVVRATFGEPPPGSFVTQVLTSPVHVVSIARSQTTGVRTAVLLDQNGAERARTNVA